MRFTRCLALSVGALAMLSACGNHNVPSDTGVDAGPPSLIPTDYQSTFTVVRTCRSTGDHSNPTVSTTHPLDAHGIKVYINSAAAADYDANSPALADGTLVIKEEHDDNTCSHLLGWSVMHKEPGFDPTHHNWHWQHVLANGQVDRDGIVPGCIGSASCHTGSACTPRDFMCTLP